MENRLRYIRLAICDREEDTMIRLENFLEERRARGQVQIHIDTMKNGAQLVRKIMEQESYDIICLESELSDTDGIQLAKTIRETDEETVFLVLAADESRIREIFDIMPAVQTVAEAVDPLLPYWANKGLMKENIQARVRGLLLMAVSNADGSLVLNTGNKSELAVGYCTMYGDMVGGLAPLADIYKSDLYELCENVAYLREVIPQNILTKAPSAELRENQKDEDSLPNYANLDAVLKDLIEAAMDGKRLRKKYGAQFANRICQMVASSQFKHHQATLAVRLTARPICTLTPEFFHGLVSKN